MLDNVSASWNGKKPILEGLALDISVEASMLPLMGPTGAGKSTLLYLIASLKWPTRGAVCWTFPDGEKIAWGPEGLPPDRAARLRREYFGFAFQDSTLSPHLCVEENLIYPLLLQRVGRDEARRRAEKTLRSVLLPEERKEFDDLMKRFPAQLAGGQRQRVALAQAMIHDPFVLFADEPAGHLDTDTRRQVMEVLKTWVAQGQGRRCLMWVTHHPDDPELMGVERFIYVANRTCDFLYCSRSYCTLFGGRTR